MTPPPLRFDWPNGVELDVMMHREEAETVLGVTRFWEATVSAVLTAHGNPDDGWQIVPSKVRRGRVRHAPTAPGTFDAKRHVHLAKDLLPTFLIDRAGQLVDVEGADEIRQRVLDGVPVSTPPWAQQLLEATTSKPSVRQMALGVWNGLAGLWAGRVIEDGATYELRQHIPMPLLGGQPAGVSCLFGMIERKGDAVELVSQTVLDDASVEKIALATAVGPMRDVSFTSDGWGSMVALSTSARSLIPTCFKQRMTRSSITSEPDGSSRWAQGDEKRVWQFRVRHR